MKNIYGIIVACLVILLCGCKNTTDSTNASQVEEVGQSKKYTITAFEPSANFPDAAISSMAYKNGQFEFGVTGDSYQLGVQTPDAPQKMCANSAKGQHIHLIINNAPYAAKYEANFDYEIPDGEHHLLAFLSRSYHESIKEPAAKVAQKVTVSNKSITNATEIEGPMIFYSRPKGTYVGEADTKKVMLDFYLVNCNLGQDYTLKADINGETHMLDKWQPYYIEGLEMGENTIELSLLDNEGKLVDTPLNPVSRTFTLKEDPAENAQ